MHKKNTLTVYKKYFTLFFIINFISQTLFNTVAYGTDYQKKIPFKTIFNGLDILEYKLTLDIEKETKEQHALSIFMPVLKTESDTQKFQLNKNNFYQKFYQKSSIKKVTIGESLVEWDYVGFTFYMDYQGNIVLSNNDKTDNFENNLIKSMRIENNYGNIQMNISAIFDKLYLKALNVYQLSNLNISELTLDIGNNYYNKSSLSTLSINVLGNNKHFINDGDLNFVNNGEFKGSVLFKNNKTVRQIATEPKNIAEVLYKIDDIENNGSFFMTCNSKLSLKNKFLNNALLTAEKDVHLIDQSSIYNNGTMSIAGTLLCTQAGTILNTNIINTNTVAGNISSIQNSGEFHCHNGALFLNDILGVQNPKTNIMEYGRMFFYDLVLNPNAATKDKDGKVIKGHNSLNNTITVTHKFTADMAQNNIIFRTYFDAKEINIRANRILNYGNFQSQKGDITLTDCIGNSGEFKVYDGAILTPKLLGIANEKTGIYVVDTVDLTRDASANVLRHVYANLVKQHTGNTLQLLDICHIKRVEKSNGDTGIYGDIKIDEGVVSFGTLTIQKDVKLFLKNGLTKELYGSARQDFNQSYFNLTNIDNNGVIIFDGGYGLDKIDTVLKIGRIKSFQPLLINIPNTDGGHFLTTYAAQFDTSHIKLYCQHFKDYLRLELGYGLTVYTHIFTFQNVFKSKGLTVHAQKLNDDATWGQPYTTSTSDDTVHTNWTAHKLNITKIDPAVIGRHKPLSMRALCKVDIFDAPIILNATHLMELSRTLITTVHDVTLTSPTIRYGGFVYRDRLRTTHNFGCIHGAHAANSDKRWKDSNGTGIASGGKVTFTTTSLLDLSFGQLFAKNGIDYNTQSGEMIVKSTKINSYGDIIFNSKKLYAKGADVIAYNGGHSGCDCGCYFSWNLEAVDSDFSTLSTTKKIHINDSECVVEMTHFNAFEGIMFNGVFHQNFRGSFITKDITTTCSVTGHRHHFVETTDRNYQSSISSGGVVQLTGENVSVARVASPTINVDASGTFSLFGSYVAPSPSHTHSIFYLGISAINNLFSDQLQTTTLTQNGVQASTVDEKRSRIVPTKTTTTGTLEATVIKGIPTVSFYVLNEQDDPHFMQSFLNTNTTPQKLNDSTLNWRSAQVIQQSLPTGAIQKFDAIHSFALAPHFSDTMLINLRNHPLLFIDSLKQFTGDMLGLGGYTGNNLFQILDLSAKTQGAELAKRGIVYQLGDDINTYLEHFKEAALVYTPLRIILLKGYDKAVIDCQSPTFVGENKWLTKEIKNAIETERSNFNGHIINIKAHHMKDGQSTVKAIKGATFSVTLGPDAQSYDPTKSSLSVHVDKAFLEGVKFISDTQIHIKSSGDFILKTHVVREGDNSNFKEYIAHESGYYAPLLIQEIGGDLEEDAAYDCAHVQSKIAGDYTQVPVELKGSSTTKINKQTTRTEAFTRHESALVSIGHLERTVGGDTKLYNTNFDIQGGTWKTHGLSIIALVDTETTTETTVKKNAAGRRSQTTDTGFQAASKGNTLKGNFAFKVTGEAPAYLQQLNIPKGSVIVVDASEVQLALGKVMNMYTHQRNSKSIHWIANATYANGKESFKESNIEGELIFTKPGTKVVIEQFKNSVDQSFDLLDHIRLPDDATLSLKQMEEVYHYVDQQQQGPTKELMIAVALVASIGTGFTCTHFAFASTIAASTGSTFLGAAAVGSTCTLASTVASNLLLQKGNIAAALKETLNKNNLKKIAIAGLSAGLLDSVSGAMNLPTDAASTTAYAKELAGGANVTLLHQTLAHLTRASLSTATNLGVNIVVDEMGFYGDRNRQHKDKVKTGVLDVLATTAQGVLCENLGDLYTHSNAIHYTEHKLGHAISGFIASSLMGGNKTDHFVAAASEMMGEIIAEAQFDVDDIRDLKNKIENKSELDTTVKKRIAESSLWAKLGVTAALFASSANADQISRGYTLASTALDYNYSSSMQKAGEEESAEVALLKEAQVYENEEEGIDHLRKKNDWENEQKNILNNADNKAIKIAKLLTHHLKRPNSPVRKTAFREAKNKITDAIPDALKDCVKDVLGKIQSDANKSWNELKNGKVTAETPIDLTNKAILEVLDLVGIVYAKGESVARQTMRAMGVKDDHAQTVVDALNAALVVKGITSLVKTSVGSGGSKTTAPTASAVPSTSQNKYVKLADDAAENAAKKLEADSHAAGLAKLAKKPEPVTIEVEFRGGDRAAFDRKLTALQDLSDRGKLVKSESVRDPNVTRKYKTDLTNRAKIQWGKTDPSKCDYMIEKIRTMEPDHVHELQLGGIDHASALRMLDAFTNKSFGSQIMHGMKNLVNGTPIKIIEKVSK